jgi:tetratricopeptide (TPR) repeat protein
MRSIISGFVLFLIGILICSAGIYLYVYERAFEDAVRIYNSGKHTLPNDLFQIYAGSADYLPVVLTASSRFRGISELPARSPSAVYNLGLAYFYIGSKRDEARAEFLRFISLVSDNKLKAEGYYLLAWNEVYEAMTIPMLYGNYPKALEYLREALRLDPENEKAKNLYERIMHLMRDVSTPRQDGNGRNIITDGNIPGPGREEPLP